jgi:hypothetical protein
LSELVALARTGDGGRANALLDEVLDEALKAARTIAAVDWQRARALGKLAAVLARVRRFNHALTLLGLLDKLGEVLQALAKWAASFEQLKQGLSVAVLREATGNAGWVRLDWREIHELLDF